MNLKWRSAGMSFRMAGCSHSGKGVCTHETMAVIPLDIRVGTEMEETASPMKRFGVIWFMDGLVDGFACGS